MQKEHEGAFTQGWKYCSTSQKAELVSDFLRESEEDLDWEEWLDFLWDRICVERKPGAPKMSRVV